MRFHRHSTTIKWRFKRAWKAIHWLRWKNWWFEQFWSTQRSEAKLVEVKEEYAKLADEYYETRHQKAAKIIADKSSNIATQLEKSQKAKKLFNELHKTTLNIVGAYNEKSEIIKINVIRTDIPENLFSNGADSKAYLGIFTETERWTIRLDKTQNEILYEFGKLKTNVEDYKNMGSSLSTFDPSISMIKYNDEFSLHQHRGNSQEYAYLSDGLPKTDSLNVVAEDVVLKIVELLLLPSINEEPL